MCLPEICLLLETTPVRLAEDLKAFGLVVREARVKGTTLCQNAQNTAPIDDRANVTGPNIFGLVLPANNRARMYWLTL